MHRDAIADLIAWKNDKIRKPLVVNGARQVGKTWLVRDFAQSHFAATAYVNFLDNEEAQRVFEGSLKPDVLLSVIGALTGTNPSDGDTLVFLDEIQECPRAITALKLFQEQAPQVPIIAAGSLLGVALNRGDQKHGMSASWPVGKVHYLDLRPMSFQEFVRAAGNDQLADILASADPAAIDALSETFVELLRAYLVVGGMPEAVQSYVDHRDLNRVRTIQTELLNGYELDFSKHVESALMTERIRRTWHSVPRQLARESDMRRFVYASIEAHARGRDYRDAVSWLCDAGLVTRVPRVSKPGVPLSAYEDETYFKLYLLDVGLLGAFTRLNPRAIAEGDRLFTEFKGVYAEQFVCQQLLAQGIDRPCYWSANGKSEKGEVDFVVEADGVVVPIEVKAEENVKGSSISAFSKRYDAAKSVRFSLRGFADQGWLVNIPLYAAGNLEAYLGR